MNGQKHMIKRQVLELKVRDASQARQLQAELSRVYRQRIVPLIDRYCTELSEPDRVHRIELLELDLGRIDPRRLEEEFVARLSATLREALAARIGEQEQSADPGRSVKVASLLELISLFARTGSLPWWADISQPDLLDESLEHLVRAAPDSLRRLMRELVREERPLRRIIHHYGDAPLSSLAGLLVPSLETFLSRGPSEWIAVLEKTGALSGRRQTQVRASAWAGILRVAGLEERQYTTPVRFFREVLIRIAVELGVSYRALIVDVHHVLHGGRESVQDWLRNTLEDLCREHFSEETTDDRRVGQSGEGGSEEIADRQAIERRGDRSSEEIVDDPPPGPLQATEDPAADRWAALRAFASRLPETMQAQVQAVLGDLEKTRTAPSDAARQVFGLVQSGLQSLPPATVRDWLPELREMAAVSGLPPGEVSELIQTFSGVLSEHEVFPAGTDDEAAEGLIASGGEPSGRWAAIRALALRLPAAIRARMLAALIDLERTEARSPDAVRIVFRLLQSGVRSLSPALVQDWLPELRKLAAVSGLPQEEISERVRTFSGALSGNDRSSTETDEIPVDLSFSDADELYIGNAGLVILWPFLESFFRRLGLLEDRQFVDPAAVQRGVGLLQYLATGEPVFPEYMLPLNKVLCGMELTDVFDFGPPLSEPETEESTDLLGAVIEQAPILRNMSVEGFRSTFLLRQGVLSARDGAWLLRVERETYDVVLDRFPWSLEWVRLPWMSTLVQVEW